MKQSGRVIEISGGKAVVEFERTDACSSCGQCKMGREAVVRIEIENELKTAPGDKVEVLMHAGTLAKASFLAYALPLAAFIAGLWVGEPLGTALGAKIPPELFSMAVALAFTAAVYAVIRLTDKRRADSGRFSPKMISVTPNGEVEREPGTANMPR